MLFYTTLSDFVLICLLAAFSGTMILTTMFFYALIPLPGFGAILTLPVGSMCLIIARKRISAPLAGFGTKILQQGVIFFLPGGSPLAHNPFLFPLMVLEGFFLDLLSGFSSQLGHTNPWLSGLNAFTASTLGIALQALILFFAMGPDSFLFQKGIGFFIGVFIVFHGLLKFLGAMAGWYVSEKLPRSRA
jgi:hypothetical protein